MSSRQSSRIRHNLEQAAAVFKGPDLAPWEDQIIEKLIEQRDTAYDLLRRVRLSSEDGTLDIPQVRHAFEAEILEAIGEQRTPS